MAEAKEYTFEDIKGHDTKKDLLMVIHENVYSIGQFVDEHPGGEEVLMDVAGQDATDSFEDVGHSDEAREILAGMQVGKLKRTANDPKPRLLSTSSNRGGNGTTSDSGTIMYIFFLLAAAVAFGAYKYLQ